MIFLNHSKYDQKKRKQFLAWTKNMELQSKIFQNFITFHNK
jgi:hypothetical protein